MKVIRRLNIKYAHQIRIWKETIHPWLLAGRAISSGRHSEHYKMLEQETRGSYVSSAVLSKDKAKISCKIKKSAR